MCSPISGCRVHDTRGAPMSWIPLHAIGHTLRARFPVRSTNKFLVIVLIVDDLP
jgi:hypothetical protein